MRLGDGGVYGAAARPFGERMRRTRKRLAAEREVTLDTWKVIEHPIRRKLSSCSPAVPDDPCRATMRLTLIALLLSTLLVAPPAAAAPPSDGSGFAFSSDGLEGDPLRGLGEHFERLRPKAFRFTVPYNAAEVPAEVERAKAIINRVKQAGVTEILVTFRQRHDQWWPSREHAIDPSKPRHFVRPDPVSWRALVRAFMDLPNGRHPDGQPKSIDDDVTMWSPAYEPNSGVGWLSPYPYFSDTDSGCNGTECQAKLAGYFNQLKAELTSRQSSDKLVSPEFHDDSWHHQQMERPYTTQHPKCPALNRLCSTVRNYIQDYYDAGGRFGDFLAWNPRDGLAARSLASTDDFLAATNAVPLLASERNTPVIVTEAGGGGARYGDYYSARSIGACISAPNGAGNDSVEWLINTLAPSTDRIKRVHLFQGCQPDRQNDESARDPLDALMLPDGSARPAWYAWCTASHSGNPNHPDCLWDTGRWYVAPSLGDSFGGQFLWTTGHGHGSSEQFLGEDRAGRADAKADALAWYAADGCWRRAGNRFNTLAFDYSQFADPTPLAAYPCSIYGGVGSTRRLIGDFVRSSPAWKSTRVYFINDPDAQGRAGRWNFHDGARLYSLWHHGHGQGSTDQFLADVNGDGMDDAVAYYKATGCWNIVLYSDWSYNYRDPGRDWRCEPDGGSTERLLDDVTGDGRADAVKFFDSLDGSPAGRWYVAPSTGSGFGPFTQWSHGHGVGSTDQFLGDVNGDRRKDAVTYSDGCWHTALSLGSGFAAGSQWLCGHGQSSTSRLLGDVTGDGKADAVTFANQKSPPLELNVSGQLYSLGDAANNVLVTPGSYDVSISATSGSPVDPGPGVRRLELWVDGILANRAQQPCAAGGCPMTRTFWFNTARLTAGHHSIKVVATDWSGHSAERAWSILTDPSRTIFELNPHASLEEIVQAAANANRQWIELEDSSAASGGGYLLGNESPAAALESYRTVDVEGTFEPEISQLTLGGDVPTAALGALATRVRSREFISDPFAGEREEVDEHATEHELYYDDALLAEDEWAETQPVDPRDEDDGGLRAMAAAAGDPYTPSYGEVVTRIDPEDPGRRKIIHRFTFSKRTLGQADLDGDGDVDGEDRKLSPFERSGFLGELDHGYEHDFKLLDLGYDPPFGFGEHPRCLDEKERFWAQHKGFKWTIRPNPDTDGANTNRYLDSPSLDPCSQLDFTIGFAHPLDLRGGQRYEIRMSVDGGDRAYSAYQLQAQKTWRRAQCNPALCSETDNSDPLVGPTKGLTNERRRWRKGRSSRGVEQFHPRTGDSIP